MKVVIEKQNRQSYYNRVIELGNRKTKIGLGAIIGIVILMSILLSLKSEPLPEFHDDEEVKEEIPVIFNTYLYQTDVFELSVPTGWTTVNGEDSISFIDPATASTLEIAAMDYYPAINSTTADDVYVNLANGGFELVDFAMISNCAYRSSYVKDNVAYIEYVYWDLGTIYIVTGKYRTENYSSVYDLLVRCAESFSWSGEKIPNGYHVLYYQFGNFSITAKDTWGYAESSDTITLTDPEYGSNISVRVSQSTDNFSEITQFMLTEYSAQNKQNYIQSSYTNTGDMMTSVATFTVNGELVEQYQYFIATGLYQYQITVEFYSNYNDNASVQTFIDNFRYY